MRCKKHLGDFSSGVGVCASCLRERLFAVVAAQTERQGGVELRQDWGARKETLPSFPRSVSPYVNRRSHQANQRFFSTPQVGGSLAVGGGAEGGRRRKGKGGGGRISSLILGLFSRPKSDKVDPCSDRVTDPTSSSGASPSWLSSIVSGRLQQKHDRTFSVDENPIAAPRRRYFWPNRERGLSPVRHSDFEEDEHFPGYSSESSRGWIQTPGRMPVSNRRGGKTPVHIAGMSFCLSSPLVRAGTSQAQQQWKPAEISNGCDLRDPTARPRLSSATSFCKSRSRKLHNYYSTG